MAFADPQSVTINAVATSLPRTFFEASEGKFTSADGNVGLRVSSAYGRRTRRLIRLDSKKLSADPLNPNLQTPVSMSVSLIVDTPVQGYTVTEQKQIVDALVAFLAASSGGKVTQLLGGEV